MPWLSGKYGCDGSITIRRLCWAWSLSCAALCIGRALQKVLSLKERLRTRQREMWLHLNKKTLLRAVYLSTASVAALASFCPQVMERDFVLLLLGRSALGIAKGSRGSSQHLEPTYYIEFKITPIGFLASHPES